MDFYEIIYLIVLGIFLFFILWYTCIFLIRSNFWKKNMNVKHKYNEYATFIYHCSTSRMIKLLKSTNEPLYYQIQHNFEVFNANLEQTKKIIKHWSICLRKKDHFLFIKEGKILNEYMKILENDKNKIRNFMNSLKENYQDETNEIDTKLKMYVSESRNIFFDNYYKLKNSETGLNLTNFLEPTNILNKKISKLLENEQDNKNNIKNYFSITIAILEYIEKTNLFIKNYVIIDELIKTRKNVIKLWEQTSNKTNENFIELEKNIYWNESKYDLLTKEPILNADEFEKLLISYYSLQNIFIEINGLEKFTKNGLVELKNEILKLPIDFLKEQFIKISNYFELDKIENNIMKDFNILLYVISFEKNEDKLNIWKNKIKKIKEYIEKIKFDINYLCNLIDDYSMIIKSIYNCKFILDSIKNNSKEYLNDEFIEQLNNLYSEINDFQNNKINKFDINEINEMKKNIEWYYNQSNELWESYIRNKILFLYCSRCIMFLNRFRYENIDIEKIINSIEEKNKNKNFILALEEFVDTIKNIANSAHENNVKFE